MVLRMAIPLILGEQETDTEPRFRHIAHMLEHLCYDTAREANGNIIRMKRQHRATLTQLCCSTPLSKKLNALEAL